MATSIALLSGANPKSCKHGPVVRLIPGTWRLNVQGRVDSELVMRVEGYEASNGVHDGVILNCETTECVQLSFSKRGSEPFITVTADRIE